MKIGCSSRSYNNSFDDGAINIFEWMTLCAKDLKVDGIEIFNLHLESLDDEYLRKIKRVAVDLHLTISGLAMKADFGKLAAEERDSELEKVEIECKVAGILGAPILRLDPGFPEGDRERQQGEFNRCINIAALLAEREGIVLAEENQPAGGFVQSFKDADRLIVATDSEWVRMYLDPSAMAGGREPLEKCFLYTVGACAKMKNVAEDGYDSTCDYPGLWKLMEDMNYRGFVNVEYEGSEDETAAAPRAVQYLLSLGAPDRSSQ